MKEHEEFLGRISCFEKAAEDPAIQARLHSDPALRKAFEAQRQAVRLIRLKRFETQSPESARRIRAGVLRTIRSQDLQSESAAPVLFGALKLAASFAVLALVALPFLVGPGRDIQPVTSFSASEGSSERPEQSPAFVGEADMILVASNNAPANQSGLIEMAPVNFDIP